MCGRFVATAPPEELAAYFGATPPEAELPENFNVAPTHDVYAVRDRVVRDDDEDDDGDGSRGDTGGGDGGPDGDGGGAGGGGGSRPDGGGNGDGAGSGAAAAAADHERQLETFHWGLVPMWAKEEKVGYRMINARAETVATKNAYRAAFKRRRCLIPGDGFYEWKVVGKDEKGKPRKQPYFIHRPDGEPLAMAGVWERWWGPDKDREEALHSVAVVTTGANRFMSAIHDRMPVFLPPSAWDEWLDPDNDDTDALRQLLVPAPEELLVAHPVDPKVGNVRNRGPELVEPYDPDEGTLL